MKMLCTRLSVDSSSDWQCGCVAGRVLRGKAFYEVQGKIYCEDDYLVIDYGLLFCCYVKKLANVQSVVKNV